MNELYQPNLATEPLKVTKKPTLKDETKVDIPAKSRAMVFVIGFVGINLLASLLVLVLRLIIKNVPGTIFPGYFYSYTFSGMLNGLVYFLLFVMMMIPLGAYFPRLKEAVFNKKAWKSGALYSLAIIVASVFYNVILSMIDLQVTDNANQAGIVEMVIDSPVTSFLWIVILGPVVEELTYRLGLFAWLKSKSRILAYLGTMIIFGLIHFDFTNPNLINELLNLPSYIIAGAILCMAYDRGGLGTSIAAHIYNNLLSFLMIFLASLLS